MRSEIPDKVYFKIGEAAELVGVQPHVLRYWESEFPILKPNRASSKQRLYRRQDLEAFLEIKRLLYDEKYTIEGARKKMAAWNKTPAPNELDPRKKLLLQIKKSLTEIRKMLE